MMGLSFLLLIFALNILFLAHCQAAYLTRSPKLEKIKGIRKSGNQRNRALKKSGKKSCNESSDEDGNGADGNGGDDGGTGGIDDGLALINVTRMDGALPICRTDRIRNYPVLPTHPRYDDPTYVTQQFSTITSEEAQQSVSDGTELIGEVGSVIIQAFGTEASRRLTAEALGDVRNLWAGFASFMRGPGGPAFALGLQIVGDVFGLGGPSELEVVSQQIQQGFAVINRRFDELQDQIRLGFARIEQFISDTVLDEIGSKLQAMQSAIDAYSISTGPTLESVHDPIFRGVCNAPFFNPSDLFLSLYGYACQDCTFGNRKRADILRNAVDTADWNANRFMERFGTFMVVSMAQALFFDAVCPPPIRGTCYERQNDEVWIARNDRLQLAYNESLDTIAAAASDLEQNWAGQGPQQGLPRSIIEERVSGVNTLVEAAESIQSFLSTRNPEYWFQIIVFSPADEFFALTTCENGENKGRQVLGNPNAQCFSGGFVAHFLFFFDLTLMGGDAANVMIRFRHQGLGIPMRTAPAATAGDIASLNQALVNSIVVVPEGDNDGVLVLTGTGVDSGFVATRFATSNPDPVDGVEIFPTQVVNINPQIVLPGDQTSVTVFYV